MHIMNAIKKSPKITASFLAVTQKTFFCKRLLTQENSKNYYDIIIAGGGMAGTTLACTLGKNTKLANKRILLLEGSKERHYELPEKYSNRVVSLNPGTINLLKKIKVWDHVKNDRYGQIKKMQVWDGVSDAMITFNSDEGENIAYTVEIDVLLSATGKVAKDIENVEVLFESKIKDYNLPDHTADKLTEIHMENGQKYTCDLLLGCDGANSQVRKAMKVHYINWNYNQMGVVATLNLNECTDNIVAWQRFLPSGPVAFLPLTNNLSSLVWSTTPEHAKKLLKMPEEEFLDSLNKAVFSSQNKSDIAQEVAKGFDNFLRFLNCPSDAERQMPPKVTGCEEGSRAAFPLGFGHASSYIGKGVALVGDAAHRMHPLAGQGVNLGFGDVSCLSEVLGKAVYAGSKLNNLSYLKEYERERQMRNVPKLMAVEGLHRLYNTDFPPLVLLRSLGLQATHSLTPLKRAIISQAAL